VTKPEGRPSFTTARLRIRPLLAGDARGLHTCYGDPRAMPFWDFPATRDLAETEARMWGSDTHRFAAWAVLAKDSERFLGMMCVHHREAWNRRLEIGYILARRYWRKGLMSEALTPFLRYCFAELTCHRIEASIEPENTASRRLAEKLGFRAEGIMRGRLCVEGKFRNVVMYALLDEDWHARHPKSPRARSPRAER
jgi:RimJ/RimL family protein N-acetyltransferase